VKISIGLSAAILAVAAVLITGTVAYQTGALDQATKTSGEMDRLIHLKQLVAE
jgi:hypothetical protein